VDEGTLYGHNAELIWYTLEAARVIGRDPHDLLPWAEPAAAALRRDGMTADGATFLFGFLAGAATDKRITFRGQAESMLVFLRLYSLTGKPQYYEAFETTTRWTFAHLVDPRTGWWIPAVDVAGHELTDLPAGMHWIAGLHVTRMLLEAEAVLQRPAGPRATP
jgi:mannose/cellobiose epimerase-like protein (N-acyl-D-glucosamine 2-epimerase family)